MSEEEPKWTFAFKQEYADCIARVASVWARLEYDVSVATWALAGVAPGLGACMTSQIYTLQGRLAALVALSHLRQVNPALIARINKFADRVREGQEIRNRILHDQWLQDNVDPEKMGRLRITAPRKLDFRIESIPFTELSADLGKLEEFHKSFLEIRYAIEDALPTLPKIPQTSLHPITESPRGR